MNTARAASIHARRLNLARAQGEDFSLVPNRYGAERWLYRLSQSPQRDRLWLNGALLFQLWFLGKNGLAASPLDRVVTEVGEFVTEPLRHARVRRKRR